MRAVLASSLAASLTAGMLQLCLVPVYVGWLGVEAWGIIGFQLALMGLAQIFDLGMATTLNRAMASGGDEGREGHALFRLLEVAYLAIGTFIGLALVVVSPWLAGSWLSPSSLSPDAVRSVLALMAVAIFGQWMCGMEMKSA